MPTVIMLDEPVHTDQHPYCDDVSCPCHAELQAAHADLQAVPSYVERDLYAEEQYYCGLCGRMREISHFPHSK